MFCTKLQLPPEPLTRELSPPYPRSLCPQLNLLNIPPPPEKKFLGTPLTSSDAASYPIRTETSNLQLPNMKNSQNYAILPMGFRL